jgi:hypothetical protein
MNSEMHDREDRQGLLVLAAARQETPFSVILNMKTYTQIELPPVAGEHFVKLIFH